MAMSVGTQFEADGGDPDTQLVARIDKEFRDEFGSDYVPDENSLKGYKALAKAIIGHIQGNAKAKVKTSDDALQRYDADATGVNDTTGPSSAKELEIE
jgi:hypothetical protein